MSDRLAELTRQRALLQQHLAWLDAEIQRETLPKGLAAPAVARAPAPEAARPPLAAPETPPEAARSPQPPAAGPDPDATADDALLEQYRVPPENLQRDLRKGCFLYFAAAFALLAVVVVLLYFTIGSR